MALPAVSVSAEQSPLLFWTTRTPPAGRPSVRLSAVSPALAICLPLSLARPPLDLTASPMPPHSPFAPSHPPTTHGCWHSLPSHQPQVRGLGEQCRGVGAGRLLHCCVVSGSWRPVPFLHFYTSSGATQTTRHTCRSTLRARLACLPFLSLSSHGFVET